MTLTLNLSPEEEARLREKAARRGQDEVSYAAGVLRQSLHVLPGDEEPAGGDRWPRRSPDTPVCFQAPSHPTRPVVDGMALFH
jgi:hypothetical protein